MPAFLDSLGISFQCRFEHTRNSTDISEAISCYQKAVQLTSEGQVEMYHQLECLFLSCFKHKEKRTDISEAISYLHKAVQLTPKGHANMPICLNNLGHSFEARF